MLPLNLRCTSFNFNLLPISLTDSLYLGTFQWVNVLSQFKQFSPQNEVVSDPRFYYIFSQSNNLNTGLVIIPHKRWEELRQRLWGQFRRGWRKVEWWGIYFRSKNYGFGDWIWGLRIWRVAKRRSNVFFRGIHLVIKRVYSSKRSLSYEK